MKRTTNMITDIFSRSRCRLRTHRHALIKLLTRQKSMAQEKHHAYRPNTGEDDTALGLTGAVKRVCQVSPRPSSTHKSP